MGTAVLRSDITAHAIGDSNWTPAIALLLFIELVHHIDPAGVLLKGFGRLSLNDMPNLALFVGSKLTMLCRELVIVELSVRCLIMFIVRFLAGSLILLFADALAQCHFAMIPALVAGIDSNRLPRHFHQLSDLPRVIRWSEPFWVEWSAIIVYVIVARGRQRLVVFAAPMPIIAIEKAEIGLSARIRRCWLGHWSRAYSCLCMLGNVRRINRRVFKRDVPGNLAIIIAELRPLARGLPFLLLAR